MTAKKLKKEHLGVIDKQDLALYGTTCFNFFKHTTSVDYLQRPKFHLIHILTRFTNSFSNPQTLGCICCAVLLNYPSPSSSFIPQHQDCMTQGPKSPSRHSLSQRHLQSRRDRSLDSLAKGGFTCPMFQPRGTVRSLLKLSCFTLGKLLIWHALRLSDLLFSVRLGTKLPAMLSHFDLWYWLTLFSPAQTHFLLGGCTICGLSDLDLLISLDLLLCLLQRLTPVSTPRTLSSPELLNLETFSGLSLHQRKTSSCILRPYHSSSFFVFNPYPK